MLPGYNRDDLHVHNRVHKVIMVDQNGNPVSGGGGGGGGNGASVFVSTELPTDDLGKDGDVWIRYKE